MQDLQPTARHLSLALLLLLAVPFSVRAQEGDELPPIIPIQHFFDNPEIAGAQISPNGQFVSFLKSRTRSS